MSDTFIPSRDRQFGELLVREKAITAVQLRKTLQQMRDNEDGPPLSGALVKYGVLDENELVRIVAKKFGVPSIDLDDFTLDPEVLKLLPSELVNRHFVLPLVRNGNTLLVAMVDPGNMDAIDDIKFNTQLDVDPVACSHSQIIEAIEEHYRSKKNFRDAMESIGLDLDEMEFDQDIDEDVDVIELRRSTEGSPVIKMVNLILHDAIQKNASDIHLEAFEKEFRIRFRIDGVLHIVMRPPVKLREPIISRLKILSGMDIAERRLPQDGRMKLRFRKPNGDSIGVDLRVNITPSQYGEKMVIRILDDSNLQLDMSKLGFETDALNDFTEALRSPYGLILVTGPTGSGKTTTLYSALADLNRSDVNVVTAENPIEFRMHGVTQHQVDEKKGLDFKGLLRAFLRADPDIILVGEVRDFETAEVAVEAAQTGHLVLTTIHTNDASSAVSRLLNMGIEPFLIANCARAILAQRLVRKLCQHCLADADISPGALVQLGISPEETADFEPKRAKGCKQCHNTGYKGRIAIYEVLIVTQEIGEFILNGASATELKREAIRQGMKTLRMSVLEHLRNGITSIDEVVRVTSAD